MVLLSEKRKLFWMLQLAGWGGWGLMTAVTVILIFGDSLDWKYVMQYKFFRAAIGFGLSFLLYVSYDYAIRKSFPFIQKVILAALLSYVLAFVWAYLSFFLWWMIQGSGPFTLNYIQFMELSIFELAIVYVAWSALYFFINDWLELQRQKEYTLQATALASEAQLQMLRYQLNPHFLFNAMNSIRALIDEDRSKARNIVTQLSDFLRFSLTTHKKDKVTLGEEFEAVYNFVEIQKIRYEDMIDISVNLDDNAKDVLVPSFLVHPLVENAVKYGMKTSNLPLRIDVNAYFSDEFLNIEVANSGKLNSSAVPPNESTGTGIYNIKERLHLFYKDQYKFKLTSRNGDVQAKIKINKKALAENEFIESCNN